MCGYKLASTAASLHRLYVVLQSVSAGVMFPVVTLRARYSKIKDTESLRNTRILHWTHCYFDDVRELSSSDGRSPSKTFNVCVCLAFFFSWLNRAAEKTKQDFEVEIKPMPGCVRHSLPHMLQEIEEAWKFGVRTFIVFPKVSRQTWVNEAPKNQN